MLGSRLAVQEPGRTIRVRGSTASQIPLSTGNLLQQLKISSARLRAERAISQIHLEDPGGPPNSGKNALPAWVARSDGPARRRASRAASESHRYCRDQQPAGVLMQPKTASAITLITLKALRNRASAHTISKSWSIEGGESAAPRIPRHTPSQRCRGDGGRNDNSPPRPVPGHWVK